MSYPNSQSCWCAILGRDTAGAPLLSDEQGAADVLLPHRPCATDHLERGRYRMSGDDALTRRYLEHCPHALLGSIVTGCDHPDAALRAVEKPSGHPAPNRVARSPFRAGAPGLGWWLGDNGVCRTDSARLTPRRYAHRIEKGLCLCVGGDFASGGRPTTNPIHPEWDTRSGRADPYALRDRATIDTPGQAPRRPDRSAGVGRKVTLFATARMWAYPRWGKPPPGG